MTTIAQMEANMTARAQPLMAACIGLKKTMRFDKNTTQTGVIIDCVLDRIENTGRALEAVFKITMECGTAKAHKVFFCRKLPA